MSWIVVHSRLAIPAMPLLPSILLACQFVLTLHASAFFTLQPLHHPRLPARSAFYLIIKGFAPLHSQVEGITPDIMRKALAQAAQGRAHILAEMEKCDPAPRRALSPYTPHIIRRQVRPDIMPCLIASGSPNSSGGRCEKVSQCQSPCIVLLEPRLAVVDQHVMKHSPLLLTPASPDAAMRALSADRSFQSASSDRIRRADDPPDHGGLRGSEHRHHG
jgi:hypothetical protein